MKEFIGGILFTLVIFITLAYMNPKEPEVQITIDRCVTLESKQLQCTLSDGRVEYPIHGVRVDMERDLWENYGKTARF